MSSFSFKGSSNNPRFIKRIVDHAKLTRQGIRTAFIELGDELVKTGRELIRKGPKTGRLYRIPGRKRLHQASAPGEPPANLTGTLARSQGYKVRGANELEYGERAEYAPFLELGTARIEPRPHLIKSIEMNERNARKIFEKSIERELKR